MATPRPKDPDAGLLDHLRIPHLFALNLDLLSVASWLVELVVVPVLVSLLAFATVMAR